MQIKDIQGRVLEDIDQYNLVYAVTEICTGDPATRSGRDLFTMEGNSTWNDLGGWIRHPNRGFLNGVKPDGNAQTVRFDVTFTSFSAVFGGACEKYIPLSVMEGMEIHLQLENVHSAIMYQWIPWPAVVTDPIQAATRARLDANVAAYPRDHYVRTKHGPIQTTHGCYSCEPPRCSVE